MGDLFRSRLDNFLRKFPTYLTVPDSRDFNLKREFKIANNAPSIVQSLLMADTRNGNGHPPETYVRRTGREINDLRAVFRKSWLLGLCIILVLEAYAAYELGLFKKKDDPKDASADIVKIANQYINLNAKYQKLQQDVQQQHDAEKEQEIARLKLKIDDQQREINAKAQSLGNVTVPDPKAYRGQIVVSGGAVAAWTACVQRSSSQSASASGSYGPFIFGASSSDSNNSSNECDALLQQGIVR
jgi:hypothetical protein